MAIYGLTQYTAVNPRSLAAGNVALGPLRCCPAPVGLFMRGRQQRAVLGTVRLGGSGTPLVRRNNRQDDSAGAGLVEIERLVGDLG
jgi:hypothetical protein